jgi:hypothetical protein
MSRVFVFPECRLTYIAYLDEFGHVGPFVSRNDPTYKESPVFGLAGMILPSTEVRSFGTWFYQRKQELLQFEIQRANKHPALWEKKGAALYTLTNIQKYRELRVFTNRLLNQISRVGGKIFYVGLVKTKPPDEHDPNALYLAVLREAIKRLDAFCREDCPAGTGFLMVLDEHALRSDLITTASRAMYNPGEPRRTLLEPPFQVESHRYQTVQAADWIAGLTGRIGATWANPEAYTDWTPFRRYFEARLTAASTRSGLRT